MAPTSSGRPGPPCDLRPAHDSAPSLPRNAALAAPAGASPGRRGGHGARKPRRQPRVPRRRHPSSRHL
eukprot:8988558-Lingulodinium_polyedra.AAC.1